MTPAESAQAGLDAAASVVATLVRGGVNDVVVSPGSRSSPLVLALHAAEQEGRVRLHVVLDERAAGFFALGLARSAGAPVGLVATSGSAGGHYLPAVIEAFETGVPLVVLTADRPPELQHAGAAQTTSQARLFGDHVRLADTLPLPEPGAAAHATRVARALAAACGPRPGPVHLDLPFREPLYVPEQRPTERARSVEVRQGRLRLEDAQLASLAAELTEGPGVILSGPRSPGGEPATVVADALTRLSRALGWPVLVEAGGVEPSDPERASARYDAIARSPGARARLAPRAAIRIGRPHASRALGEWLEASVRDRLVLIDAGGETLDPAHLARSLVVAEPGDTLARLADHLESTAKLPRPDACAAWRRDDAVVDRAFAPHLASATLWEGQIAAELGEWLRPGDGLHLGNGMPIRDFDAFARRLGRGVTIDTARGVNGIDGTLATAAGEAWPARRGAVLVGDLATLHDLSGLRLIRDLGVPLAVVVVDNAGGGVFDFLPIAQHATAYGRLFRAPQSAELPAIARGLGLEVRQARSRAELCAALELARAAAGPTFIHVPVDGPTNVAAHRAAWADAVRALDALGDAA